MNREHDSGAREEDPVTPCLVEGGSQDQSAGCVSVVDLPSQSPDHLVMRGLSVIAVVISPMEAPGLVSAGQRHGGNREFPRLA